ncbi:MULTISPECIES: HAD family hydrolase [Corynebacterium]|uniref:HAD family hydrolase n=1 Tax=Corynebacterium TaxID=1716 RepID=UPI0008A5604E|nr:MULTISPECIES: HAD family hydrolase [Corynebacterium]OFT77103.1 phosphoserine phosphatase [Corynebacterium sp. HMSC30G07]PLA14854.1 HAD-IB family hydrolase [Corynebacterium riegelii]
MTAAFFDLDKTIIATSSAFAFGKEFMHNGMITRAEALELYWAKVSYMLVGQSSEKMDSTRDALAQLVEGWKVEDVQRITQETMRTVVTPAIYAEARELINQHKAAGHDVIIISASASILVEPIARELGIDTVVATEMGVEDGRLTGEITNYLKGDAKADAVHRFAEEHGYNLAESYAYSDSATDIPMLEMVGNPVAVNPERALKKHAAANGWEIRIFKNPEPLIQMPNAREVTIGASVVAGIAAVALAATLLTRQLLKDKRSA